MRVLFASSEAYPLIKTGGLADVSGSLPRALLSLGHDVRVLLPAYRDALAKARTAGIKKIAELTLDGFDVNLLQSRLPGTRVKTWLLDCPALFDRPGNPYHDQYGDTFPDNDRRFLLLSRAAAELALNRCGCDWVPDVLHCNDWQTALAPALLSLEAQRPATVFTIHNLAYQGLFSYDAFLATGLPAHFWSFDALEFYDQLSFIKGGIVFADRVNTVSPSYAQEIQTPQFGYGLDGLLRYRSERLSGILNGIDDAEWNPGTDKHLEQRYNRRTLALKMHNKLALQTQLGLPCTADTPLVGFIGRLVEQKGIDWLLACIDTLLAHDAQLVLLGSGAREYETALFECMQNHPRNIAVTIGYDEALAHRIEAGADVFLMPSRFEPCGLNQMYSLRYGTVPLVHRVGGLADTVIDVNDVESDSTAANGFVFVEDSADAMRHALLRALEVYRDAEHWQRLQFQGMSRDFSWRNSAQLYEQLYRDAIADTQSTR
ncbi:MAG TPA: glycogen synthase GlgA [Spongiibacteraceae bacterium]|nr:glycogen synthase GlgA [Spongiibacteraceae bacterium]